MERYETYKPVPDLPEWFPQGFIAETEDGVVVSLYTESPSRVLSLRFQDVPAFRCIKEECHLSGFHGVWDEPNKTVACFIVRNSRWVAQFSEGELVHYPNLTHYVFITGWREIEVLSSSEPEVLWRKNA